MRKICTRVQLEVNKERITELELLMQKTGIRTKSDLLDTTITWFEIAVRERATGRIITSLDESSGKYKELVLPSIERVAPKKS